MYQYNGCGLEGIFLKNGYTVKETPYGRAVAIQNVEGLHMAIALDIVSKHSPMNGQQFRFLRKEQDLTQEQAAGMFRVDVQTIANWEKKDHGKAAVSGPVDVAMRAYFFAYMHRHFRKPEFEADADPVEARSFELGDEGWLHLEAA